MGADNKDPLIHLHKDGEIVRSFHGAPGHRWIVPRVSEGPVMRSAEFRALPVEVILDRYNPAYEHYFPTKEYVADIYAYSHKDDDGYHYEWEGVERREGPDYDI